jgi:hypothetical protein
LDFLGSGRSYEIRRCIREPACISYQSPSTTRRFIGLAQGGVAEQGDRSSDEVVEEVIDFLRNWANFTFPRYLMAVDHIQRSVFTKVGPPTNGDCGFFASQVENWFVDSAIMALDEHGIPNQVA